MNNEERQIITEAEMFLQSAAAALSDPGTRECLVCYLNRQVPEFGCDSTLRFAFHFRDLRAPRATALEARLNRMGGYCDCEVLLNGYEPSLRLHETVVSQSMPGIESLQLVIRAPGQVGRTLDSDSVFPDAIMSLPDAPAGVVELECLGVRAGSSQPCAYWERMKRRESWEW